MLVYRLVILLNIHYRNNGPAVVDNSGFRIYYTDELRKYDAVISLLQNGMDIIPQQQPSFTSYSYCPSQCFQLEEKKKKKKTSKLYDLMDRVSQDFADFRQVALNRLSSILSNPYKRDGPFSFIRFYWTPKGKVL